MAALSRFLPAARAQRCRVHKTVNAPNHLPMSLQESVKSTRYEIWQAGGRLLCIGTDHGLVAVRG
jgi:transposase-like protein